MIIKRLAFEPILIRYLASEGVDVAPIINDSRFATADRQQRLYRLAVFGKKATSDELLGLKIGKRAPLSAFGVLGHAMLGASTLRQMLQINLKNMRIFQAHPANAASLGNRAGRVYLTYLHPIRLRGFSSFVPDLYFSSILQSMRAVGCDTDGMQLELDYSPADKAAYVRELGIPVKFGMTKCRLSAPIETMDAALPGKFSTHSQSLLRLAENALAKIKSKDDLHERIIEIMTTESRGLRASEVANILNISERSLRRKLRQGGSSFTNLSTDLHSELARTYLSEMPVQDVAELLGYHDPSTFRRAFRRWTGLSPGEYRRNLGTKS